MHCGFRFLPGEAAGFRLAEYRRLTSTDDRLNERDKTGYNAPLMSFPDGG
jgi:hypothetical protein